MMGGNEGWGWGMGWGMGGFGGIGGLAVILIIVGVVVLARVRIVDAVAGHAGRSDRDLVPLEAGEGERVVLVGGSGESEAWSSARRAIIMTI